MGADSRLPLRVRAVLFLAALAPVLVLCVAGLALGQAQAPTNPAASLVSGTNTGDVTLTTVGASANANGSSLSGQQLRLQPASASFPGAMVAADFSKLAAITGTNTGNVTLAAVGAAANANGATLTAQALNLEPASASFPGVMSAADFSKLAAISGTNTGNVESFGGYTGALNTEAVAFAGYRASAASANQVLTFTVVTAGVAGGGSAVLELVKSDGTQRAAATFACDDAAGTVQLATGTGAVAAAEDVRLRWAAASDCTTLPLGNGTARLAP